MMASFAIIAGCEPPAFAGAAPPVSERQTRLWSDWWMNEIERQYVPTPQLLYVWSSLKGNETDFMKLEEVDGRLNVTAGFKTTYPSGYGFQHDWHRRNAGLINTEAFILPSSLWHVNDNEVGAFKLWRLLVGNNLPELWGLRPPRENSKIFSWMRNIRAPATIRSCAFSQEQFEDGNPLRLNIPKRLSEQGEDLRAFEYHLNLIRNYSFFDPDLLLLVEA